MLKQSKRVVFLIETEFIYYKCFHVIYVPTASVARATEHATLAAPHLHRRVPRLSTNSKQSPSRRVTNQVWRVRPNKNAPWPPGSDLAAAEVGAQHILLSNIHSLL